MNLPLAGEAPAVAVIGGGLAGLAAAVALRSAGCRVELFEARRSLGGRAASFRDPDTGELVDHCQHVSMTCCTNLADFCRRTGISKFMGRDRVVNFIGPDRRHYRLRAARFLPAPLHLLPGFLRLRYLSLRDRLAIARALWKLMRGRIADGPQQPTIGPWLKQQGQSAAAVEQFWAVILTSALGEELDRASLSAARKVLVDGFLAARDAYVLEIPQVPLGVLYGEGLTSWFAEHGVTLNLNTPVRQVKSDGRPLVIRADGAQLRADFVVLAVPWSKLVDLLDPSIAARWPWLEQLARIEASPITGVHLWFDRSITDLPHAVLVGRLSQWIFSRGRRGATESEEGHYYQVVISASRALAGRDRKEIVAEVCAELADVWPSAATARLLRARVVTEQGAVFSARPGFEQLRPAQQTPTPGVLVAGDWTATSWPATMESAVRSGYLAAEAILRSTQRARKFLVPDLSRGLLAQLLVKS